MSWLKELSPKRIYKKIHYTFLFDIKLCLLGKYVRPKQLKLRWTGAGCHKTFRKLQMTYQQTWGKHYYRECDSNCTRSQCNLVKPASWLEREWSILSSLFTFCFFAGWRNHHHGQIWRLDRICLPHRIFTLGSLWSRQICISFCFCGWGKHCGLQICVSVFAFCENVMRYLLYHYIYWQVLSMNWSLMHPLPVSHWSPLT